MSKIGINLYGGIFTHGSDFLHISDHLNKSITNLIYLKSSMILKFNSQIFSSPLKALACKVSLRYLM